MAASGPLSAPEAMVIVSGPRADPHDIVFVALLELVVRGGAALVHLDRGEDEYTLAPRDRDRVQAGPLAALFDAIVEARSESPAVGTDYVANELLNRRFARRWGTASRYVRREVWTQLEQRGLVSTRPVGLDVFAVYPWHLTKDGESERERLRTAASDDDWRARPATTLLPILGLPVPSDETFDAIDELEDLVTPGDGPMSDAVGSTG